jgi:hypothetical protein
VYPDATEESFRSFDLESPLATNADMRLFLDILDALDALYPRRPGAGVRHGVSRGGFFVNFLNCRLGALQSARHRARRGRGPYGPDDQYDIDGHFMCEATAVAALLIHGVDDKRGSTRGCRLQSLPVDLGESVRTLRRRSVRTRAVRELRRVRRGQAGRVVRRSGRGTRGVE